MRYCESHFEYRPAQTACPRCTDRNPLGLRQWTAILGLPEELDAGEEVDVWARDYAEAREVATRAASVDYQAGAFLVDLGLMTDVASGPIVRSYGGPGRTNDG